MDKYLNTPIKTFWLNILKRKTKFCIPGLKEAFPQRRGVSYLLNLMRPKERWIRRR